MKIISKISAMIFIMVTILGMPILNGDFIVNAATNNSSGIIIPIHYLSLIAGGDTGKLKASILPANAVNKSVTWSSNNEAVATVNSSGVVTPVSKGIAIITVKTVDRGYTDSCVVNVDEIEVTGISLSTNQATIKVGGTITLKPTILPDNASNKNVIWSSGDETIAKVSSDGIVTGVSQGATGIMGKTEDGDFRCYSIIFVTQPITSITLSQNSMKFNVGDAGIMLTGKVNPENVSLKDLMWTSSNPRVAYRDYTGKVIPISPGSATITATSVLDGSKKATCSVTVTGPNNNIGAIPVTNVTLNSNQADLVIGNTLTLKATVLPTNASIKIITWSSSNESIATVSSAGVVTPKAEGYAAIIARSTSGAADICTIKVIDKEVTGISLDSSPSTIKVGRTLTLKPTIAPADASNKNIIWSSSNEAVAKINGDGIVTGVSQGSVGIMGRTEDGDFRCYKIIFVTQPVTSITLSQTSMKFTLGDASIPLTAKVNPDNVSIKDVVWSSSNPSVAYMDSTGRVIPVSAGTTTITATSVQDSSKKATCSVTVTAHPSGVIITH